MKKGIGKCIICGNDEIAEGRAANFTAICEDISDYKYFEHMMINACTHCGFVQLTSVLPQAIKATESPSEAAAEEEVYGNDCRNGQC